VKNVRNHINNSVCPCLSPYPSEAHRLADLYLLLYAGHDSTAGSLTFIMMEVARHPEVLRGIQKEIDAVGLHTDKPFQIDDLTKLVYLDQVIKEGMRLWPVIGIGVGRKADIDYFYKDMVIPKGCSMNIQLMTMFRQGIQVFYTTIRTFSFSVKIYLSLSPSPLESRRV